MFVMAWETGQKWFLTSIHDGYWKWIALRWRQQQKVDRIRIGARVTLDISNTEQTGSVEYQRPWNSFEQF